MVGRLIPFLQERDFQSRTSTGQKAQFKDQAIECFEATWRQAILALASSRSKRPLRHTDAEIPP